MGRDETDVIVVGAGFTGLSAARALLDAGMSVIILEARDAPGGRVRSFETADGTRRDSGGQFFCDDMPEVVELTRSFGLPVVTSRGSGEPRVMRSDASEGKPRPAQTGNSHALYSALDAARYDDPRWEGLTVVDWLDRQNPTAQARQSFLGMVHGLWCLPASDIPVWYLLDCLRRNTAEGSELQYFLKDSLAALADAMAGALAPHLRLSSPVAAIIRAESGVTVKTGSDSLSARHVLVAVPPVRAREIAQEPPLPVTLVLALAAWRSGAVIKVFCRYARRSWPTSLSSGFSWDDVSGLFAFDVSVDTEKAGFVVFIGGPLALDWREKGEAFIAHEVGRRLDAVLGEASGAPLDIIIHDWTNDRWSGGGYSDVIVDGEAHDAEARLRDGVPGVSFACSELSPSFPTYVEGAIVAGRMAAARIVAALGRA
jgi:monoamine oxidase